MPDTHEDLAAHGQIRILQHQVVVFVNGTGQGIFQGQNPVVDRTVHDGHKDIPESLAGHRLDILAEMLADRQLAVSTTGPLEGNPKLRVRRPGLCLDLLEHISISSMPATGLSAPVQPFGALALAAAEVIGGMIAVKILTGKPVTCAANIFPGDLREGSMVIAGTLNVGPSGDALVVAISAKRAAN